MDKKILHFTIGPVQGFINDARRLRDYWAGSFLLSLLSGHAMQAVTKAGGQVVFPQVENDPLFTALSERKGAPYIGSLPNRFMAVVSAEEAADIARRSTQAVNDAWAEICEAIWDAFFESVSSKSADGGSAAARIWQRQIQNFWSTAWVVGEAPNDGSDGAWLDLRKNWRTHFPDSIEDGDHCRLMGQYQELSGFHRIGGRRRQQAFWECVRAKLGQESLDVSPNEPLCAIASVKRLFPILVRQKGKIGSALPFCPGDGVLNIRNWPSTSYIAASPWLRGIDRSADGVEESLQNYAETAKNIFPSAAFSEWESPELLGLPYDRNSRFFRLDGHLLHEDAIPGTVKDFQKRTATVLDHRTSQKLQASLKELQGKIGNRPSEFYAILRMDGDSIGAALREEPDVIKAALADFTRDVAVAFDPGSQEAVAGVLVYAGGDDVLAVLPADEAIETAMKMREIYSASFAKFSKKSAQYTLSGSIIFAHFKRTPLSTALRQSSHYLDVVAKDQNGRNSLAIAVLKPGGVQSDWVCAFEAGGGLIKQLDEIAQLGLGVDGGAGLAGGFFHAVERKYGTLFKSGNSVDMKVLLSPLVTHQLRQQYGRNEAAKEIRELSEKICSIYSPLCGPSADQDPGVSFGGGQVIRFLNSDGTIASIANKRARHDD
ncbi:type III-B CRISPR-associated protein Cas10/Cmr2 [Donghicola mangrovi]|uniref:Type III-B CRISPR-associated protein Cas10/Cmr2 n=1 Tax=Donghicola mangrovi TaxID=2729614 RepID=A0A850QBM7_9RHOB|nr:type III-B CRISPR-associated protein Cas10/Cmr2 [Donghicola mangrovi]NVO23311.1 type III-B CRISPR-associated protein Cas10/Cmr2 [Donghicola mangrovi]